MFRFLEKIFEFCASLKLAIVVILGIAFYLGAATFYEAQYGTRAVQAMVYGSTGFVTLMAMLAINVMAAVLFRYPWKRKQTGFIITHVGIEILLGGCLLSFRNSVDGRVQLTPGASTDRIDGFGEQLNLTLLKMDGRSSHVIPLDLWADAGFPTLWRYVLGIVAPMPSPRFEKPRAFDLGDGAKIEVMDWLPAARLEKKYPAAANGWPAVHLTLAGLTPRGMPVDEDKWLYAPSEAGANDDVFDGVITMALWKSHGPAEVDEFLHAPKPEELPGRGRLAVRVGGQRFVFDVSDATIGKKTPLGETGCSVTISRYLPSGDPKSTDDKAEGAAATDPTLLVAWEGSNGRRDYAVSARDPQRVLRIDAGGATPAQPGEDGAVLVYYHPGAFNTDRNGTRGKLQLLQTGDKLYARVFGLAGLKNAFEVQPGLEMPSWMGLKLAIVEDVPSAMEEDQYVPAHVPVKKLDESTRAIKIALTVNGQRRETWITRGSGDNTIATSSWHASVSYGYEAIGLPFTLGLKSAEQKNDPGSSNAANWSSIVDVSDGGGAKESELITMNKPMTKQGLTFYQAGFEEVDLPEGMVPVSTLSVRRDPGTLLKYLGCAGIVGGIFTMFYMKAYFQKGPQPKAEAQPATKKSKAARRQLARAN